MSIQHRDIPDSELHEPKGVVSASASNVYVATGAATGTWRKITEEDVNYTSSASNKFGWNYRKDDAYNSATPLAIASGIKTLLPNDGLNPLTDISRPLGIVYTGTQFTPSTLNSSYVIRVALKAKAVAAAGTPYTLKITMEGGAAPAQFAGQDQFIKGGSYVNDIALTFLFYTGSLNTANPIKIYITPDTAITVYDIDYLIQRTYIES